MEAVSNQASPPSRETGTAVAAKTWRNREGTAVVRRPILVTVAAAIMAVLGFVSYTSAGDRTIAAFLAAVLVVVAAVDIERRIIPNRVVLPALAIVLLGRIIISPNRTAEVVIAAIGAAAAFVLPNLINRSAMGMGDVKLASLLGAGLGWGVIGAVVLAFLSVFPFAVGTLIRRGLAARTDGLPFGPFLAFGGLVILIVPRLIGAGGG